MRSLRARLLALLTGTVLAAWAATALFTYFDARSEIDAMLDAHLEQSAALLAARTDRDAHPDRGPRTPASAEAGPAPREERVVAFQLWEGDTLRSRSPDAPETRLSGTAEGFSESSIEGDRWRVYGRRDAQGRYLVQVGERRAIREELAQSVASHLLHPLAVALPALALLIWLAITWAVRPLDRIAREVAGREPDNLAPLDESGAPGEAAPLLRSLNALFARVSASIDKERRFTSDAAHELRTPLAAVKTHVQVAMGARGAPERERALAQAVAGLDRSTRLVEQLLVLARLDPGATVMRRQPVRLDEAAAACLAELAPAAAARRIELGLEGTAVTVGADPVLIEVLLRNLVDNAVRYTPDGGAVSVTTQASEAGAVLVVEDTGPGIPAAAIERATERFYRVPGSASSGSGLGLSIVERIAQLHAASLRLGPGARGQGLRVEVVFPPP
ncbi:MAG TPA: ATP-binding protein [Quisquiliibacterium sp.]|nr:ATP-binding protein [Quisquiliibacterium sp.]